MDFRSRASSNFSPNIVSEIGSTDFVEVLVGLQAEAAGDDFFLDLGGAAEDRLDGQVLEMASLWDCWDSLVMTSSGGMSGGRGSGSAALMWPAGTL
jgi:hypothetical protein